MGSTAILSIAGPTYIEAARAAGPPGRQRRTAQGIRGTDIRMLGISDFSPETTRD